MNKINIQTLDSDEKVRFMAQLSCLQVKAAVVSGETQFNHLTTHFTELLKLEKQISDCLKNNQPVDQLMGQLRTLINQATIEFQFFDRFKQKLDHAIQPIENWSVKGVVVDPTAADFIAQYSTMEELNIYNALITTGSIEVALEQISPETADAEGEIELF